VVLELQTALFRDLLGDRCDGCDPGSRAACDEPVGLNRDGFEVDRPVGDDVVVSWPACPHRWGVHRRLGGELVPLDTVAAWAVERGVHRRRRLPAPTAALLRHYIRARETPGVMRTRKTSAERELERKARDAAGPRARS